ncbi:MAG TPA: RraA family protein [Polyangiaceae bacterium]|jgi:regulator of RNase E activity RraA|nr:RraA family protein [Polyangiaceae bacterium]
MPDSPLSRSELDELAGFDTPTICNALELVAPERRALGFTSATLICPFPARKPMVGYARTGMIRAAQKQVLDATALRRGRLDYYRYVAQGELPKLVVIQDLDSRQGFGCFWGEVNSAIHQGLGCEGVITDGGVRDLDALAPGFGVLCGKVTPSHAHVHPVAFGTEVEVFGMLVRSDDLVHADRHGAVVIPHAVARDVAAAARLCARREAPILKAARSPGFSIAVLEAALAEADEIH